MLGDSGVGKTSIVKVFKTTMMIFIIFLIVVLVIIVIILIMTRLAVVGHVRG